ncbi:A-kinase anchor protein SPHKAP isoform X1 [Xenopus laevis]|uniref:A-kinase anchor protein SPHKAP isoform X1 n=2 Tax=Xenopus laevis TaxID=8355 RepID=A0A1L8G4T5_XENLA|nr:A-kinase anchor protein SPHKAP isoform X1 [Xenopus laevis]OCT78853.1 hypothetical protein XELAEV_18029943mg [Xenopus laevis]
MWPYVSQSNLDMAAMYGPLDNYGSSGCSSTMDPSTSNLGSSITACKKILCSSRPGESLDYWLQNSRNLCRIGLIEGSLETHCTSVCFVNLNVMKEDSSHDILSKKLLDVSADIPKLMTSMKAHELKENEIILLSGLTSGRLRPGIEGQQVSWPTEICLLQYTRALGKSSPSCILLELNKFLLGLELAQENTLQHDSSPFKAEDDTNCSVSSIEEDFLTASEQLEDESEGENCRGEPPDDIKNIRRKVSLQNINSKETHSKLENYKDHIEPATETLHSKQAPMKTFQREELLGEICLDGVQGTQESNERRLSSFVDNYEQSRNVKRHCLHDVCKVDKCKLQAEKEKSDYTGVCTSDHFGEPATTGQYATNLAECVLQDAFIRLSQPESSFTKEAAVSISARDTLPSGNLTKQDAPVASRSWNDLPKIVIVQSPDSYENPTEWTDESHCLEQESPSNASDKCMDENGSVVATKNTLEMALACAASVIGTITSPQTAKKIKIEHEGHMDLDKNLGEQQRDRVGLSGIALGPEYSVPSALCEMTQVASAVAVFGLGEQKQISYPTTASGLLAAADASTAMTLHCSITLGSSLETLKDNIAKVLLSEASMVLTSPCAYRNIGEFIESLNERILSSVNSSKLAHVEDVVNDDLAHNLSDSILRYSAEQAIQRLQSDGDKGKPRTQGAFVAAATELLFNVMHFTCKKMGDLLQSGDLPFDLKDDKNNTVNSQIQESQSHGLLDDISVVQKSEDLRNRTRQHQLCKNSPDLKHEHLEHKLPQYETNEADAPAELYNRNSSQANLQLQMSSNKPNMKREMYRRHHNEHRAFLSKESTINAEERKHSSQNTGSMEEGIHFGSQEKLNSEHSLLKDFSSNSSPPINYKLHPSHAVIPVKHSATNYCLTDFADDLAETVVSMATEIAAICLENSHGKQPWFCAWAKGSECLIPPCRTVKRKKDTSSGGSVVRRHRPPRLSEIKKKTDEHPELKERLMNRVVDESINLEDVPDAANAFANEVALKIMNLTESSVADTLWQGAHNRLHCDRWSRGKASSYESIPEEDSDAKSLPNTLDPSSILGLPFSRTGSVSKQSSCESITDEFSRFMVNQMENEGREFELLLDYYAGNNAANILNSALQQVSKINNHLNVKTSCLSKQSSTESITEEFYRYMLKEIDKENKEISNRNTAAWTSSLQPPTTRTPFCFRQSSMPCNRSSSSRLTVNTPVKANSLDGFARCGSQDFLYVQPVSAMSSINLCKSDSCLYQRCQTDQVTDMLIHETWSSSIEDLMRKNKIIVDSTEDSDVDLSPKGSPAHVDNYANKLAANIVQSGKSILVLQQESLDDSKKGGLNYRSTSQGQHKDTGKQGFESENVMTTKSLTAHQPGLCFGPRDVPLIQIETEQRDETEVEEKGNILDMTFSEDSKCSKEEGERNVFSAEVSSNVQGRTRHGPDVLREGKTNPEPPIPASSSEDSNGSWSQLANKEENPEDTNSVLQLSEHSVSNSNSSTASSAGAMDLEAYLEEVSSTVSANINVKEKNVTKDLQDNLDECTSGLSVGTASYQHEVSVINIDLESDCIESELHTTLQWIAASQLGIPAVFFRKSQEQNIQKFLEVTHLVQAKSWKVGDIFSALILHCKMQKQGNKTLPSFFDWLLERG